MENYYNILNVSNNADEDQIKHAYRALAMKYHPDKNPDNKIAEEKFKRISEAYSVLSDPQKRRDYNFSMSSSFNSSGKTYTYSQNTSPFGEDLFSSKWWKKWRDVRNENAKKREKISRSEAFKILIRGIILTIVGLLFFKSIIFLGIFGLLLALSLVTEGVLRIRKGYMAIFD
ncbi:DnaJ domain-containing protein [Treponema sp. OMZ 792]|uniref:DnaJ domain-containing protein n=1 Tax=unclassified Treponema TaxID=2638727 RepID=UPI0020A2E072|nr:MULTISPECIES: DnaJ domain-containing protein [unclassified Treponema]UTC75744.1 DnaJ domain-containing protein [Treponema sp. OMZ 792]UTC79743.1 DnaJ domain-containing protein [Treponema sp. OMZ 798]